MYEKAFVDHELVIVNEREETQEVIKIDSMSCVCYIRKNNGRWWTRESRSHIFDYHIHI